MNGNVIQIIALLEETGKKALHQATREAFSNTTDSEVKSLLFDFPSNALSQSIGTFASKFIQAFFQVFYGTEEKPRGIETVVSALVREPLITGLEQLRVANKIVSFSEEGRQYKIERLRNALYSLDRARSLASEEFEIALIDLLRGLCTFELPGGTSETIVHLAAFQIWAHKEIDHLVLVREEKERKAERLNVEIEDLEYSLNLKPGNGPLYLALWKVQNRAQSLRAEIDEITLLETKILDTNFYITSLLEVGQKIMTEGA